jgi:methenyltetrahydromethanopterin cyclohydrolase
MRLNQRAAVLSQRMIDEADALRVVVHRYPNGCRVIDCGIEAAGGLEAGRRVAEICLAGLGEVSYVARSEPTGAMPAVLVRTDHPLNACMSSQYAGWQLAREKFFAMASGPMRALAAREPLFEKIGRGEDEPVAVGVLEGRKLPPEKLCEEIAQRCRVAPEALTLLIAPTASQVGTVQVVARSVETAMHKLFELGFDLARVESGFGVAPLPPVAKDDLEAMGRTNDAILYGAEVTLWIRGAENEIKAVGQKIPSETSPDHGRPFLEIFNRYERDFYKIDPNLFAPAVVNLVSLESGRAFHFGHTRPEVLGF